jgi:hypothetical protein
VDLLRIVCAAVLLLGASALADEVEPPAPSSYFTVAFSGGVLVPGGPFENVSAGLDVGSRVGWTSKNGFGGVLNLEYAPLRRDADPTYGPAFDQQVDSSLFVGTLAPRYTIGHSTVRLWFAAGGGLVVEHRQTEILTSVYDTIRTETDTLGAISGATGFELHVFSNGGLQVSGGYTRSITGDSAKVYDFFSLDAGLVFVI